ncbi:hypothetical protein [Geopseudomonas aromaticivorans]
MKRQTLSRETRDTLIDPASLAIVPYVDITADGGDGPEVISRRITPGSIIEVNADDMHGRTIYFDSLETDIRADLNSYPDYLEDDDDTELTSSGEIVQVHWDLQAKLFSGEPIALGAFFSRASAEQALRAVEATGQALIKVGLVEPTPVDQAAEQRTYYVYAKATGGDPDYLNNPLQDVYGSLWEANRRAQQLATAGGYGCGSAWVCNNPYDRGMLLAYQESNGKLLFSKPVGLFKGMLAAEAARYVEATYVSEWDGGTQIESLCVVDMQTGVIKPELSTDEAADEVEVLDREFVIDAHGNPHTVASSDDNRYRLVDLEAFKLAQLNGPDSAPAL